MAFYNLHVHYWMIPLDEILNNCLNGVEMIALPNKY